MQPDLAKQLRALEKENARLKKLKEAGGDFDAEYPACGADSLGEQLAVEAGSGPDIRNILAGLEFAGCQHLVTRREDLTALYLKAADLVFNVKVRILELGVDPFGDLDLRTLAETPSSTACEQKQASKSGRRRLCGEVHASREVLAQTSLR